MSNWNNAEFSTELSASADTLTTGLVTLADILTVAISTTKSTIELVSSLRPPHPPVPHEELLRGLLSDLNELLEFLKGATTQAQAHVIFLPIQKRNLLPSETLRAPTFSDFRDENAFHYLDIKTVSTETVEFFNTLSTATGGTQALWRTLLASVYDEGDNSRPVFPDTYAIGGAVLLIGSKSLKDMLGPMKFVTSMLNAPGTPPLEATAIPTVTGVKVTVASHHGEKAFKIKWEPMPTVTTPSNYSDDIIVTTEIFVVRSEDPVFREKFEWSDVFTSQPTSNQRDLPSNELASVVARLPNDGGISDYVDTFEIDPGKPYYYTIIPRFRILDTYLPMGKFSSVQRVHLKKKSTSSKRGTPPDWFATPTLSEVVPVVRDILQAVEKGLKVATHYSKDPPGDARVTQTVDQLQALLDQLAAFMSEMRHLAEKAGTLRSYDRGGVYTTTFAVPTGGTLTWLAELARRMSDPEDDTVPTFDSTDLVCGVVILAGAPSLPSLEHFMALIDLFFGTSGGNPVLQAINEIEGTLAAATQTLLDPAMQPTRVAPGASPAPIAPPARAFTPAMLPGTTGSC